MWLLCDDALVSCPQRDTIQTVSSSVLLHRLCRSLSRILENKRRKNISSSQPYLHLIHTQMCRLLTQVGSGQQAPKALAWQSEAVN